MQSFGLLGARVNIGKRDLLLILGLSFYWPMFRAPYLWTLFSAAPDYAANQNLQALFYCVILLGGILACFSNGSDFEPREPSASSVAVLGTVTALGNAAVMKACCFPGIEFGVALMGIVLSAAGFLGLTISWFASLTSRSGESILRCVALSFLLSFAFGVFDYLPAPLSTVPLWLLPFGTAMLQFAHSSLEKPEDDEPPPETSRSIRMSIFGVLASIELLAGNTVRGLWAYLPTSYTTGIGTSITYALSLAAAAALALIAFTAKGNRKVFTLQLAAITLLLIAGVMIYPFEGTGSSNAIQANQFIVTANTGLQCVFWAAMATCVLSQRRALIQAGGVLAVTYASISLVSLFIIPKACGLLDGFGGSYSTVFSVICMGVIAVGCLACAVLSNLISQAGPLLSIGIATSDGENDQDGRTEGRPPSEGEPPESASSVSAQQPTASNTAAGGVAQALSSRYGLTARESEIAVLIARGYSVRRIAEMLVLSPNTVQGYSKCVYRKLGVHSKQSVIDIANEIMAS